MKIPHSPWKQTLANFLWRRTLRVILCGLVFCASTGFSEPKDIQEINVSCHWQTTGPFYEGNLKIINKENNFFICSLDKSDSCNTPIETEKIANLLRAIQTPSEDQLNISHLGIYPKLLEKKSPGALKQYKGSRCLTLPGSHDCHEDSFNQIFLEIYRDYRRAHHIYTDYFHNRGWTDDDPHFRVVLLGHHQKQIQLDAYSQKTFMLPWKINRNSKKTMTYRPEVPMALYEILPEKYSYKSKDEQRSSYCLEVNRGRLKADPYRFLAHLIGKYEVESEWRKRLSERRLGPKYRKVQRAYKIKRSTVTSGDDPVWEARLMTKDPGFPLEFEVRLPLSRLKQKPIENFVSWLNKKKKTIRSIPWLKKALMEQPSEVGRISIIHSSRHDPKETFLDKLENLNLSELKSKLKPKMEQAIFFKISHPNPLTDRNLNEIETHWVLFSDGQLILYRLWSVYTRVTVKDLISLKASFLEPIQEMKTFNAYFVAVVNPDGTLSAIYKK